MVDVEVRGPSWFACLWSHTKLFCDSKLHLSRQKRRGVYAENVSTRKPKSPKKSRVSARRWLAASDESKGTNCASEPPHQSFRIFFAKKRPCSFQRQGECHIINFQLLVSSKVITFQKGQTLTQINAEAKYLSLSLLDNLSTRPSATFWRSGTGNKRGRHWHCHVHRLFNSQRLFQCSGCLLMIVAVTPFTGWGRATCFLFCSWKSKFQILLKSSRRLPTRGRALTIVPTSAILSNTPSSSFDRGADSSVGLKSPHRSLLCDPKLFWFAVAVECLLMQPNEGQCCTCQACLCVPPLPWEWAIAPATACSCHASDFWDQKSFIDLDSTWKRSLSRDSNLNYIFQDRMERSLCRKCVHQEAKESGKAKSFWCMAASDES